MRGVKVCEFRSVPTNIRERVYVYAGLGAAGPDDYMAYGLKREDLPAGFLVGSVEVVDCEQVYPAEDGEKAVYAYKLANPWRLNRPLKPENHPQPILFRPFG